MIYMKTFESFNRNYNYIINTLHDEYKWGNAISTEINNFEQSSDFDITMNNNDYILAFNSYLNNKFKTSSKFNLIVDQPRNRIQYD